MDFIIQEISHLLLFLKSWEQNYNQMLKECPPGGLIRIFRKGQPVYMHAVPDGRYRNGRVRYAKTVLSEDCDLLKRLALKEYLRVAINNLNHNIRCLERSKEALFSLAFEDVRSKMRKPYRLLPDELFSRAFPDKNTLLHQHQWAAQPYNQSTYRPEEKTHFTSRGLAMRSRAELLIAEALYRYDIPFRYEQVFIAGKYEMAPDFTFLGADGKEFYWEYCGMMSDPAYRNHHLWRRDVYENFGVTEWDNMIITYDAKDSIDMREIEAIIKTKILPRVQGTSINS